MLHYWTRAPQKYKQYLYRRCVINTLYYLLYISTSYTNIQVIYVLINCHKYVILFTLHQYIAPKYTSYLQNTLPPFSIRTPSSLKSTSLYNLKLPSLFINCKGFSSLSYIRRISLFIANTMWTHWHVLSKM